MECVKVNLTKTKRVQRFNYDDMFDGRCWCLNDKDLGELSHVRARQRIRYAARTRGFHVSFEERGDGSLLVQAFPVNHGGTQ